MIMTVLSNMTAIVIMFIIGITCIVLPIFFLGIIKKSSSFGTRSKAAIAAGVVLCVPMIYYLYLDLRYDVSDFTNEDKLVLAVENDDIKAVKKLLDEGADCEKSTRYGVSSIYRSVQLDNPGILDAFINKGADPNYTGNEKITLLGEACKQSSVDCVRILLNAGADPDYNLEEYVPALHYAAAYDKEYNYQLVRMLLDAGADPASHSVSGGKVMLPYRYYYNCYKYDTDITDADNVNYQMIKDMLYRPYIEWLKEKLEKENISGKE